MLAWSDAGAPPGAAWVAREPSAGGAIGQGAVLLCLRCGRLQATRAGGLAHGVPEQGLVHLARAGDGAVPPSGAPGRRNTCSGHGGRCAGVTASSAVGGWVAAQRGRARPASRLRSPGRCGPGGLLPGSAAAGRGWQAAGGVVPRLCRVRSTVGRGLAAPPQRPTCLNWPGSRILGETVPSGTPARAWTSGRARSFRPRALVIAGNGVGALGAMPHASTPRAAARSDRARCVVATRRRELVRCFGGRSQVVRQYGWRCRGTRRELGGAANEPRSGHRLQR